MHVGRDHADGCGDVQAVVNGVEVIGLGASAGFARATQAVGIDFGEFAEEVECADAVPELKSEDADVPEHAVVLFVGPGCAVYNTVGFFLVCTGEMSGAVVVIDHVPHEGCAAHSGKGDAPARVGCVAVLDAAQLCMPVWA